MQTLKFSGLDDFRLLGRSGLRVSPLCLGTMTFGTDWGWGADQDECRKMFDLYVERGGNLIDTANNYTHGTSETFLGEFIGSRRDQLVVTTKYSLNMRRGDPNAGGNHRKNLVQSVEASLKRLKTDYIDIYYLHAWEFRTPIEEVMRALDDLVRSGKVLYLGISDVPAWKVSQANTIADLRGWTPFIALQAQYSLVERSAERDLISMAQELNIGVMAWGPLAGGVLTGKYNRNATKDDKVGRRNVSHRLTERNLAIAEAVQQIAEEVGRSPAQVSIQWLLNKPGVVIPILGARTAKQLEDNLGCLDFSLLSEQIERLDDVSRIDLGFPHSFLADDSIKNLITGGVTIKE
ncbi:MAG: aldo/keto reductase [Candidatus Bipolaricaulia bacterium]